MKNTMEEMMQKMKELQEARQNDFIDKLSDMVENLYEKAMLKDYKPTSHEKEQFKKILETIQAMEPWF